MINAHARSKLVPRNFSIKLTADYLRGKSNAINTILSSSLSTFCSIFVEIDTMLLYVWLAEKRNLGWILEHEEIIVTPFSDG